MFRGLGCNLIISPEVIFELYLKLPCICLVYNISYHCSHWHLWWWVSNGRSSTTTLISIKYGVYRGGSVLREWITEVHLRGGRMVDAWWVNKRGPHSNWLLCWCLVSESERSTLELGACLVVLGEWIREAHIRGGAHFRRWSQARPTVPHFHPSLPHTIQHLLCLLLYTLLETE